MKKKTWQVAIRHVPTGQRWFEDPVYEATEAEARMAAEAVHHLWPDGPDHCEIELEEIPHAD